MSGTKRITDTDRLNFVLVNMVYFSQRKSDYRYQMHVWTDMEDSEALVYVGKDYRECLDKAIVKTREA
jgi:hypothetical protein